MMKNRSRDVEVVRGRRRRLLQYSLHEIETERAQFTVFNIKLNERKESVGGGGGHPWWWCDRGSSNYCNCRSNCIDQLKTSLVTPPASTFSSQSLVQTALSYSSIVLARTRRLSFSPTSPQRQLFVSRGTGNLY